MFPSPWFFGRRVRSFSPAVVSALSSHGFTAKLSGSVIARRHLPTWKTRGRFFTTGTPASLNEPDESVSVEVTGLPETVPHLSQFAPLGTESRGALGTWATPLYGGTSPAGSYTLPESEVVPPFGHWGTWRQRLTHGLPVASVVPKSCPSPLVPPSPFPPLLPN